jgi:prolyl-tRNA synthetase
MYAEAERARDARIADVKTVEDAAEAAGSGWARLPWSELGPEGEAALAERSVTVRCLLRADGSLPETGDEPDVLAYCARAY